MKKIIAGFLFSIFFLGFFPAWAGIDAQRRERPPRFLSPEIHGDRTVTFRLYAPQARQVRLNIQFEDGPQAMAKDENGVWSLTLGPVEPRVYYYSFDVDGFQSLDPANPYIKVALRPSMSLLVWPGDKPMFYEEQDVPHGILHIHRYLSGSLKERRGVYVYTPPDYSPRRPEKYPVLYLLHGSGDNEAGWSTVGRAHFILDNLLAEKRAAPMLIVMPFGHVPTPADRSAPESRLRSIEAFEADLLNDVIPLIEKAYRVSGRPEHRAIAGLSMGGGQSVTIGLRNIDLFGWVGAFSASVDPEYFKNVLPEPEVLNRKLGLFWIGCGKDDFLFERNTGFIALLKQRGINHVARITEGVHTWTVWRDYLHELLPLLFRD